MSRTNGKHRGNGQALSLAAARKPDAPAKRPKLDEATGGQSTRSADSGGVRSGLQPGYGAFDLNPPPMNMASIAAALGTRASLLGSVVKTGNGDMPIDVSQLTVLPDFGMVLPGYGAPSPGTYQLYRKISSHWTIALAQAVVFGPVLAASWSYESDDGVAQERVDFIRDSLDALRSQIVSEALRALTMGWKPFEKVWEVSDGYLTYKKIKPLLPDYTRIIVDKADGSFAGLQQDFSATLNERVILPPNKCFVYTYDGEAGDFYGRSRHENVRSLYQLHADATMTAGRLGTKISSIVPVVKYPEGSSLRDDPAEVAAGTATNRAIAQAIINNLSIAKGIAFQTENISDADLRANPELAKLTKWAVEALDTGQSAAGIAGLVAERTYFDVAMFRGWLVPERAALEGTHGTLAEAEAHADIAVTGSQLVCEDIVRYVNWYLVDELLALNFGEDARGTVWIQPSPIIDQGKANMRTLFAAMLANPATLEIVVSETNRDSMYEQLELPAKATEDAGGSGAQTGAGADGAPTGDPVADAFARARGDAQAAAGRQAAADQSNADRKVAMQQRRGGNNGGPGGLSLDMDDTINRAAIDAAIALANCGDGAGGFQPGNTCAGGGDGGSSNDPAIAHGIVEALKGGGISYQPIEGSSPIVGFAVSPFKGKELVRDSADAISEQDVIDYIKAARDAAKADPRVHVGGWIDDRDGKAYLDLSVVVTDKAEAERIALANDQEAYFDVGKKETVFTKKRKGDAGQSLSANERHGMRSARAQASQRSLQACADRFDAAAGQLQLNCGTGAGGFRPGNTCAAGGGVGRSGSSGNMRTRISQLFDEAIVAHGGKPEGAFKDMALIELKDSVAHGEWDNPDALMARINRAAVAFVKGQGVAHAPRISGNELRTRIGGLFDEAIIAHGGVPEGAFKDIALMELKDSIAHGEWDNPDALMARINKAAADFIRGAGGGGVRPFADGPAGRPPNAGQQIAHPTGRDDFERYVTQVEATPEYHEVVNRLEAAAAQTRGGLTKWSHERYTDAAGNYTPARAALHEQIAQRTLTADSIAAEGTRPQAVILIGAPGSGKTSAGAPYTKKFGVNFATINPDNVKEAFPEYAGWNAALLHEESWLVTEHTIVPRGITERHNMLFDSTGKSGDSMTALANKLGAAGYDVHVVAVSVPSYESTARAWDRFQANAFRWTDAAGEPGRFVPPRYAYDDVDSNPDRTYLKLKDNPNVASWVQVNNNVPRGAQPTVMDQGHRRIVNPHKVHRRPRH